MAIDLKNMFSLQKKKASGNQYGILIYKPEYFHGDKYEYEDIGKDLQMEGTLGDEDNDDIMGWYNFEDTMCRQYCEKSAVEEILNDVDRIVSSCDSLKFLKNIHTVTDSCAIPVHVDDTKNPDESFDEVFQISPGEEEFIGTKEMWCCEENEGNICWCIFQIGLDIMIGANN